MIKILPAVIPYTLSELETKFGLLDESSDWVHLDISDGDFTPNVTWSNVDDLKLVIGRLKVEVHLMIDKPEEVIPAWIGVSDRLIIHPESTEHLNVIIDSLKHTRVSLGLALLLDTPITEIEAYLDQVDMVQLMSIKRIGYQGEKFDLKVIDKINNLRKLWPRGLIQIDGGIKLDNVKAVVKAGANSVVVGSGIWTEQDPLQALELFKKI